MVPSKLHLMSCLVRKSHLPEHTKASGGGPIQQKYLQMRTPVYKPGDQIYKFADQVYKLKIFKT